LLLRSDSFASEPMTPQMVEEILGISARDRLKWTKDGRLPTCGTASFTKGRVTITYALHPANRIAAMKSDPAIVAAWRNDDAAVSAAARKHGAKQATKTRVENEAHRKSARDEVEAMARDAARQVGSPIAVPLVKLPILAIMCSRWAKHCQERKDFDGKEKFYGLKDRALKVFAKQPWTTVRYLPGLTPRIDVQLCEDHRDEFREARHALGYNF
jgi:hypothetical protein